MRIKRQEINRAGARRSRIVPVVGAASLLAALWVLPSAGTRASQPASGGRPVSAPDLDIRGPHRNGLMRGKALSPRSAAQRDNLNALSDGAPGLAVRWSALTGSPSRIRGTSHPLTGPSTASAGDVVAGFLNRNLPLFDLSAQDLGETRHTRDAVSANNGVTHLTIQQQLNGLDVFGAVIRANVDKQGRLWSISGEPMPRLHGSTSARNPVLSSGEAIARAAAAAGVATVRASRSEGLVYFPVAVGDLRLAWKVIVEDARTPDRYRSVVDAADGTILWRENGTKYAIATHGAVFDGDSPIPDNPIVPSPASVPRADRLFTGGGQEFPRQLGTPLFGSSDPHFDWWNGAARTVTTGNNCQAQEDRDGDDSGGTQANATSDDFTQPLDLTQDPSTYTAAAVVNLFYWVNRYHDITYRYGFTEAFGNYQSDNFGLGGSGGDPVIADAQDNRDGGSLCNANFDTSAPEGSSGRMQMFQCNNGTPERDGDFSAGTMIHEAQHGLSTRLTSGLGGAQGGGMGEGGGDFEDICFLAKPGDDPNGSYGHSQYQNFNANGNRRSPYSIRPGVYPFTYGDIATSNEVHNNGEIWANALWIARALLVSRYGFLKGTDAIIQLQVDGYKMSPSDPDFLDMRDSIMDADTADYDGANQCLLWQAFARMGIGASATSTGEDDSTPAEAFDTPFECTAKISINPSTLNFGLVPVNPVGSESGEKSLDFNVCNVGNTDLFVTDVVLQAPNAAFTIVPPPPDGFPLPISHDFCHTVEVRCNPDGAGETTATVQIESTDPDNATITPVTLSCTGAVPRAQVSPNPLSFGNVPTDPVGGELGFKDQSLKVRNTGDSGLQVTSIAALGGNAADFSVLTPVPGFPTLVAAGSEFDFQIRCDPSAAGTRSTTLRVTSNSGGTAGATTDVSANCIGTVPDIRVSGATDFGDVCGGEVKDQVVSVCNVGPSNLNVTSATIDCADFTILNNPFPAPVSPDFCVPLTIRFTPTSAGPKTCHLTITSNDPDTPVVTLTLHGNTPIASIDVPPDLAFPPTVISSVGACSTPEPFPVSNTGKCPLSITAFGITVNPDEFSIDALPSFPIILEPGHEAGEGDLSTVFAPDALGRNRSGTVRVTYVSDPITGSTMSTSRLLCGEGARTGARVLVTAGGIPLATVEQIKLARINANRNKNLLDTVDNARNLALQTVTPAAPCTGFQYHREYGTVSNPIQLLPGSYNVTVTAVVNGKRVKKTVGFDLTTCGFNPSIVVNF